MKSPSYPTLVRAASSSSPRRVSRRSSSRPTNSTRHWPCLARIGGHLPFDEPIRHPRRSSLPTVRAIIRPLYVQSSRPSHVRQVPMPRGGERADGGGLPATAIYSNHHRRHVVNSASHIATLCQIKRFWNWRRGSGHPSNRSVCWIVS